MDVAELHVDHGAARADVDERQHSAHLVVGVTTVVRVAVAELTVVVAAPALELAVDEARAAVVPADLHVGHRARAELHTRQEVPHLVGGVTQVAAVAVAELAVAVVAPALHDAVVEQGAHMVAADRHVDRGLVRAKQHRRHARADLSGRVADLLRAVDAELAVVVAPPALDGAVRQPGAGVVLAHADLYRRQARAEVHDRVDRVDAYLVGVVADAGAVAHAQLAVLVAAPAAHRAVIQQRAAVVLAHGDLDGRATHAQVGGGEVVPHLEARVADLVRVPDAELAIVVQAEAAHLTVVEHAAGVVALGVDEHLALVGDDHVRLTPDGAVADAVGGRDVAGVGAGGDLRRGDRVAEQGRGLGGAGPRRAVLLPHDEVGDRVVVGVDRRGADLTLKVERGR